MWQPSSLFVQCLFLHIWASFPFPVMNMYVKRRNPPQTSHRGPVCTNLNNRVLRGASQCSWKIYANLDRKESLFFLVNLAVSHSHVTVCCLSVWSRLVTSLGWWQMGEAPTNSSECIWDQFKKIKGWKHQTRSSVNEIQRKCGSVQMC